MISKQTTLDLNGPILSFTSNPVSVSVCNAGIATFIGIATATFPTTASNTGYISYQWYDGNGALSNGTNVTGSATTTLTVSNLTSPTDNDRQFYLKADYIASAYGLTGVAVTVGSERYTGNAINDALDSNSASLTVFPVLSVTTQPTEQTVSQKRSTTFTTSASVTDNSTINYQWTSNGVQLSDGITIVPTLSPQNVNTTQSASGFNGSGIYLDLTSLSGNVSATFSTFEESGIFHYINIPGIKNFPENNGTETFTLSGGTIYGPCSAPNGGLYIGAETPVGGNATLVVEEGGDDWNDMILYVNVGYFRRLTSAPTVTVTQSQTTSTVNAEDSISGSKTNVLTLSSNTVGVQTVRCIVTHPTACNSSIFTNIVNFNVVNAGSDTRQIVNVEFLPGVSGIATLSSWNLFTQGSLSVGAGDIPTGGAMCFYAPEKSIDVFLTIIANSGADNGGYKGGQGGSSTIKLTLQQNVEYIILPISQVNSGGSIFIYKKSGLIAVVGGGGNAGNSGNGGDGGGVNISGASGFGRGAGFGGTLYTPGTLPSTGIFGSTVSASTKSGDVQASAPSGGRVLPCPRGDYWYDRGYSACQDMGNVQFYTELGNVISNSTSSITRGFKAGYSIRNTAGAGTGGGGNGGNGATGGNGGNGGGGGGGGSGYSDGSIEIISTRQGGNFGTGRVTISL